MVREIGKAITRLVTYVVLYLAASAGTQYLFTAILVDIAPGVLDYKMYVDVLLAIGFGYAIVSSFAQAVYWFMRIEYAHPTAAAIRNVFKIIGIGALVAGIAGSLSSPTAGVALGGFMGMVIGFASQRVLGQAMSGLLILITRPFMINDVIEVGGDKGVVEDVRVFFTVLRHEDGRLVLLPNNSLLGSKIIKYEKEVGESG